MTVDPFILYKVYTSGCRLGVAVVWSSRYPLTALKNIFSFCSVHYLNKITCTKPFCQRMLFELTIISFSLKIFSLASRGPPVNYIIIGHVHITHILSDCALMWVCVLQLQYRKTADRRQLKKQLNSSEEKLLKQSHLQLQSAGLSSTATVWNLPWNTFMPVGPTFDQQVEYISH